MGGIRGSGHSVYQRPKTYVRAVIHLCSEVGHSLPVTNSVAHPPREATATTLVALSESEVRQMCDWSKSFAITFAAILTAGCAGGEITLSGPDRDAMKQIRSVAVVSTCGDTLALETGGAFSQSDYSNFFD